MTSYHDLIDRFEAELKEKVDRAYDEVEREIEKLCRSCTHELVGDQCRLCLAIVRGDRTICPYMGFGQKSVGRYDHLKFQTGRWRLQTQRRCKHIKSLTPTPTHLLPLGLHLNVGHPHSETFYTPRRGAILYLCELCGAVMEDEDYPNS